LRYAVLSIYTNPTLFYTKPIFDYTKDFQATLKHPYLCIMELKIINTFWRLLEPRFWWLRHIFFWSYFYSNYIFEGLGLLQDQMAGNKLLVVGDVTFNMLLVYSFLWFIKPYLWLQKKYAAFLITMAIAYAVYIGLNYVFFNFYFKVEEGVSPFVFAFQYFFDASEILLYALGLRFLVEYLYNFERTQAQQNAQLRTELAYLKNQINPHFLFNTLNNIATLSEVAPERVTPTIVELSNVLRYQLYESEKESVFLADEIDNLKQNLSLEALRLNKSKVDFRVEGSPNGKQVAPLLFLPFLENALKHSADPSGVSTIDILFKIEDDKLVFTAKNSKPPTKPKQLAGGLGLKNIQRRLELLYPNKHDLQIEDLPNQYSVVLTLVF
jgi:sensor histidine kinase YesM